MSDPNKAAFPCPGMVTPNGDMIWPEPGITVRQYYAAKAMAGMLAATAHDDGWPDRHMTAALALSYADALLAAES